EVLVGDQVIVADQFEGALVGVVQPLAADLPVQSRPGGPIGYDIGEPVIEAGDDVAFCHGLTHMTGTKTDGELVDLWVRSTVGRRRTAAGWQITHEHDSTPFYMDGSGLAANDLRP